MRYSKIPWKYRVEEPFAYKLQCQYTIAVEYTCAYFTLTTDGWLVINTLYGWDGATKFPDFDWIKTPSAIHDALHAAIAAGAIPETENDLIDKELSLAIEGNVGKKWLLAFRGWYVRRGTNTVDEARGAYPTVYTLPRLKNEYSIDEFVRMRQL